MSNGKHIKGARDSWLGIANSTRDCFKVKTYLAAAREDSVAGDKYLKW